MYKNIAVFCGSKMGNNLAFEQQASELGSLLAANKFKIIYGGGNKGLMGAVANAALANIGEVIGVIPEVLVQWEHAHNALTELIVTPDMHTRKRTIYNLCDAAVVLPGGNGTLDELYEMLTWNTLNIHSKTILLLNTDGYYKHLIAHMTQMQTEGFLYGNWQEKLLVFDDAAAIIAYLCSDTH